MKKDTLLKWYENNQNIVFNHDVMNKLLNNYKSLMDLFEKILYDGFGDNTCYIIYYQELTPHDILMGRTVNTIVVDVYSDAILDLRWRKKNTMKKIEAVVYMEFYDETVRRGYNDLSVIVCPEYLKGSGQFYYYVNMLKKENRLLAHSEYFNRR